MSEFLDTAAIHDINGADLPDHATWGDGTVKQPHEILPLGGTWHCARQTYGVRFRGELLLVGWDPRQRLPAPTWPATPGICRRAGPAPSMPQ